jgi:hypothetical protein
MSLWPTLHVHASQVSIVRLVTQDGTGVALIPEIATRSINVLLVSARSGDMDNDIPYDLCPANAEQVAKFRGSVFMDQYTFRETREIQ